MARRTQTYAIRLAVEGGGQVKAELVSVGQSGEQSLKRIESVGERASGGLKGLGRQAELLRTGIRTLDLLPRQPGPDRGRHGACHRSGEPEPMTTASWCPPTRALGHGGRCCQRASAPESMAGGHRGSRRTAV